MIACGRSCCICHRPCGVKIEIHHIEQKAQSGDNSFDNAIPVCLECHADIGHYNVGHPKGTKFSPSELRGHRDSWYSKVRTTGATTIDRTFPEIDKRIMVSIHDYFSEPYMYFKESPTWPHIPYEIIKKVGQLHAKFSLNSPDMQFMDANLEQIKNVFFMHLRVFYDSVGSIGVYEDKWGSELYVIKPFQLVDQEVYDRLMRLSRECDDLIDAASNSYDEFYKAARLALGVDLMF